MDAKLARKLVDNFNEYDQLELIMATIRLDALQGFEGTTVTGLTADTIVLLLDRGFQVSEILCNDMRLVSW